VAQAPADGYHVLAASNGVLSILPSTQQGSAVQSDAFVPLGSYVSDWGVVAVKADSPWEDLEQFVDHARKNPGQLSYGSAGDGTVSFFAMDLLNRSNGLEINHIPFAGSAPARDALLEGRVAVAAFGLASASSLIASGALRPLINTSTDRISAYPDVPTFYEKGLEEAAISIWMGLFVASATPQEAKERLANALAEAMQDPAIVAAVDQTGLYVDYRNADAARQALERESTMIRLALERQEPANE
jgi:tripartite-type tricarboxylate transporter receptor subunit TctC